MKKHVTPSTVSPLTWKDDGGGSVLYTFVFVD